MSPEPDPGQRDDPVESGALESDDGTESDRPPERDEPVEGGALDQKG